MNPNKTLKQIRFWLILFFLGILFGLHTVVFAEVETAFFAKHLGRGAAMETTLPVVSDWIEQLHVSVSETYEKHPAIAYCMDWLSYACIVFAIFIIGAIKDPVRNIWIIQVYMIACVLAFLLPFIVGPMRQIPVFWRFLDCSFGLIGFIILWIAYQLTKKLQTAQTQ